MKMKKIIVLVLALVLAFAAMFSLAACGTTQAEEIETTASAVVDTVVETEDGFYEVNWELPDEELQKKFLEDFDEGDEEKAISENSLLVRVGRCFRVEHLKPNYTVDFVGSTDVPADQLGWGYDYKAKCAPSKGCTYVLYNGKLQSWTELELNWEVEIPNALDNSLVEIHSVERDIVVIHDTENNSIYLVYDRRVRELATNVVDFVAGGSIWWLNTDGEVYKLQDYIHNPAGEAKLLATDVIALSPSTSDAPGWFVEGECNPEYIWVAPINGEFVPMK